MSRDDWRVRKSPCGFRISQRIGSGWETLADVWPTRRAAWEFVRECEKPPATRAGGE